MPGERSQTPARTPPQPGEVPDSTYRIQLNAQFDFAAAAELAPYLRELGISHCYASPYLKARPGSTHGYDIIDHNALNPELGNEAQYRRWTEALARHGLGQILDFVPNHMGVMGGDNQWWLDVLENGPASAHAAYFDIDWTPLKPELRHKLLIPVLGDHYGAILESGELRLAFDPETGSFHAAYYEHRFPIDPREYAGILAHRLPELENALAPDDRTLLEYKSLITAFEHLPPRDTADEAQREERQRDKEIHKRRLGELYRSARPVAEAIDATVADHNGQPGDTDGFALLHRLLEGQAYRLAYWQTASDEINYRRFFDINDLAGIRMENPQVFEATHRLVLELIAAGRVHGLRLDHPDGLYDPAAYFYRLRARMAEATSGGRAYLVVEKILASHEHLRQEWSVDGTTGYETANLINGLFIDPRGERPLDRIYRRFGGERRGFDEILYECKRRVMETSLGSELNVLANQINRISESDPKTRDYTLSALRNALLEVVAAFPVYRTYITSDSVTDEDTRYVDWAVAQAKKRSTDIETSIFDFVHDVLLLRAPARTPASWVRFAMRFQQYTAPVMAKGLEDTAFYVYNRLVSLNEVGGDPRRFNATLGAFHHLNQERAQHWPHTLISSTTHDTKRSEDVRARIDVISELAAQWQTLLVRWSRLNRSKKMQLNGMPAPSRGDEYLLYQTLLGAWPLDPQERPGLAERIRAYMLKAAREAKVNTSWINPNPEYEEALGRFVDALIDPGEHNLFLDAFVPFQERIARVGIYNSLSQCLLKLTSPGVPDIYQGNELWDLSLVDPDNRRPVDYARRRRELKALQETFAAGPHPAAARALLDHPQDGRVKLYLTWRALTLRRAHRALFLEGDYIPLGVTGSHGEQICAYARSRAGARVLVLVPRLIAHLLAAADPPLGAIWADTQLVLPADWGDCTWRNVFTGEALQARKDGDEAHLPIREILVHFPLALLEADGSA